jgi:hypothetical protein
MGARYAYCLSSNFQWDFHIPHHPGLKCEPPSLVPALQIHELNGGSDAIGEVIAEAAEAAEQLVWVPEGILDGAATLVNAGALSDYVCLLSDPCSSMEPPERQRSRSDA